MRRRQRRRRKRDAELKTKPHTVMWRKNQAIAKLQETWDKLGVSGGANTVMPWPKPAMSCALCGESGQLWVPCRPWTLWTVARVAPPGARKPDIDKTLGTEGGAVAEGCQRCWFAHANLDIPVMSDDRHIVSSEEHRTIINVDQQSYPQ